MTSITEHSMDARAPARPPISPDRPPDPMPARRWLMLLGTWLGLASLLILVQLGRKTPTTFVDELLFGRLAQNIAAGEGRTLQGLPLSMSTVYPLVVAPAWTLFDGVSAYRIALGLNALAMTGVVLPSFALTRRLVSFRWALAAAACAALVPAMVWSGMLMTEAVAYPAAAVALLAMVEVLRRPTLLGAVIVAATVGAAYLIRIQLIVLAAVFVVAVSLDVLRGGRHHIRERVHRHRAVLAAAAVGAVLLGVLLLVRQTSFGTYACVVADAPSPRELAGPLGDYVGTVFVATLGVPLIALASLALTRRSWRDERLAPLLCVGLAATLAFLGEAAWTAVTASPELQERYVFYITPILLPCLVAFPGRVRPRTVAIVALAGTVYAIAVFPGFADVTGDVVAERLGLGGFAADLLGERAVLWGAAFAVLGLAAFLAAQLGGTHALAVAVGVTALFGMATLGVRQLDANRASTELAERMPQPLDIVDRLTGGEPAGIVMGRGSDRQRLFHMQLWNHRVDRAYRIGIADRYGFGQLCPIVVGRDGTLASKRSCAGREDLPRWLVFVDQKARMTFPNGAVRHDGGGVRVVEYPPAAAPRVRVPAGQASAVELPPEQVRDPDAPLERCTVQ
jgi:hypothetical protein